MKFSIIIPVHNAQDRITRALNIIASQTFKDFELICVCDACTDNSAEICKKYTEKVFEVDFHNDGLARSYGLDKASGDYILFHDDDDYWNSLCVLDVLDALTIKFDKVDVFCFGFEWQHVGRVSPFHFDGGLWMNVWSKLWKRSAIGDTRFPNVHSVSDAEFCKLMFEKDLIVLPIDYTFYHYNYMRPGSITEKDSRGKENGQGTERRKDN